MQTVEPFRCVTLNTNIPLGIGNLRNATQRKYLKWKHARNISQNDAVNVYLPLSVFISNTFSMLYQFLFRCVTLNTIIPLGIDKLRNATQRKYLKWKHARNISQNDAVNVYLPLSVFISNTFSMLYQFLFRCVTLNTIVPLGIGKLRNATQRKYLKWKHARNISQNDAVNVYLPLSVFISNTFSMLYQFLFRCVTLNTIIPLGIGNLRNATQRKYLKWKHARNISQNDAVNVYLPLSVFISNTFSMLYQFLFRCVTLNTIIPLGIGNLRNATQRKYLKWKHARNISQNDAVNVYLPLSVFISNNFSMLYQFLLRCVALRKLPI